MKLKDLISVIDDNAFLNIISECRDWLFMDKAVFITSDLLVRKSQLNKAQENIGG